MQELLRLLLLLALHPLQRVTLLPARRFATARCDRSKYTRTDQWDAEQAHRRKVQIQGHQKQTAIHRTLSSKEQNLRHIYAAKHFQSRRAQFRVFPHLRNTMWKINQLPRPQTSKAMMLLYFEARAGSLILEFNGSKYSVSRRCNQGSGQQP